MDFVPIRAYSSLFQVGYIVRDREWQSLGSTIASQLFQVPVKIKAGLGKGFHIGGLGHDVIKEVGALVTKFRVIYARDGQAVTMVDTSKMQ